jgi:hypothetical protein
LVKVAALVAPEETVVLRVSVEKMVQVVAAPPDMKVKVELDIVLLTMEVLTLVVQAPAAAAPVATVCPHFSAAVE